MIAGPISLNGTDQSTTSISIVESESFTTKLLEWSVENIHGKEEFLPWLVIEQGRFVNDQGI